MDLLTRGSGSSANIASRGGRGGFGRGGGGHGHGNGGGRGCGRGNNGGGGGRQHQPNNGERPTCQLCGKEGHTVIRCYKHFDASFQGVQEQCSASSATTSYSVDTNWYSDTGTTDHVTGELEKLTVRDKYHGND